MDREHSQCRRRSNLIPLTPAQPSNLKDLAARESRSLDAKPGSKVENEVNVQVILRCRPLNEDEMKADTPTVIFCDEIKGEVSAVHHTTNKQRTYSFDRVFGPTAQQKELFQTIAPIIDEVLEGYTCTVFAYGQTGTGKTYTMEGQKLGKSGELPGDAGIIPRAVQQIFHALKFKDVDYSMKVTYLEIYNEEMMELLAPDENLDLAMDDAKNSIILMEDSGGATFLRGLKQELIHSADEIYGLFEKGSMKRRTAETLLNNQSSGSHSIFSVSINVKDCTPEGEDLIKCGKLNLVDLAGSENIIRSGARELRAREAGEINKSLLTLGRVINALVEHSGHIPYRDSKLTRLLKDSLGGTAKTYIIATLSPSITCLDETLSTLDYAFRAKSIKNRPAFNHRTVKSELIKDLYTEIGCLRKEVNDSRKKNDAYRSQDHYQNQEKQMKSMAKLIEDMELTSELKQKKILELRKLSANQKGQISQLRDQLESAKKEMNQSDHSSALLKDKYDKANAKIKERDALISDLRSSEKVLMEQILKLQKELENAALDVSSLSEKAEIHDKLLDRNKTRFQNFHVQLTLKLEHLHKAVAASAEQQQQQMRLLDERMQSFMSLRNEISSELAMQLIKIQDLYCYRIKNISELAEEVNMNLESTCHKMTSESFKEKCTEGISVIHELKNIINSQEEKLTALVQGQREVHFRALELSKTTNQATLKFFENLRMHMSNISKIAEDSQVATGEELSELAMKFELRKSLQLMERVAELLESSDTRKKKMVQEAMNCLLERTASRTRIMHQEMPKIQDFSSNTENEWTTYVEKMELAYLENAPTLQTDSSAEESHRHCIGKADLAVERLESISKSVSGLEGSVASVTLIAENGVKANDTISSKLASAILSALEEANPAHQRPVCAPEDSYNAVRDSLASVCSIIESLCQDMREIETSHKQGTLEITENANHLLDKFKVDVTSSSAVENT